MTAQVLAQALGGVADIDAAYVYGSSAARFLADNGDRPVGDIDLLVLGSPDRDAVYAAASSAEQRLGRPVQVTVRANDWLTSGIGTFHDTVASRPMVPAAVTRMARADRSPAAARRPGRQPAPSTTPTPRRRH